MNGEHADWIENNKTYLHGNRAKTIQSTHGIQKKQIFIIKGETEREMRELEIARYFCDEKAMKIHTLRHLVFNINVFFSSNFLSHMLNMHLYVFYHCLHWLYNKTSKLFSSYERTSKGLPLILMFIAIEFTIWTYIQKKRTIKRWERKITHKQFGFG